MADMLFTKIYLSSGEQARCLFFGCGLINGTSAQVLGLLLLLVGARCTVFG